MSIFEYIDEYGKYSFWEKSFNEVDNVILSVLSYLDLDGIVSSGNKNKRSINEVSVIYFKLFSDKNKNILAVKNALDIFRAIGRTKRYKDILMYGYCYVGDEEQQFSAVSLDIFDNVTYISFEGTDHLISGWKEDFCMAYQFPVLSQKRAIKYVNKYFSFSNRRLILGGHSKGGNLALVASMYCNWFVRNKIIQVYNNDGPGLRKREIESKNYELISDRLIHIIPNYSVVGLLLRHKSCYKVIKSNRRSILSHSVVTWEVDGDHFKKAELSTVSKVLDEGMIRWLDKYSDKEREKFVVSLFDIFKKADINNLLEIIDNKKLILKLIRESGNIDEETKKMILDFIPFMFRYYGEYQLDKIKEFNKIKNL